MALPICKQRSRLISEMTRTSIIQRARILATSKRGRGLSPWYYLLLVVALCGVGASTVVQAQAQAQATDKALDQEMSEAEALQQSKKTNPTQVKKTPLPKKSTKTGKAKKVDKKADKKVEKKTPVSPQEAAALADPEAKEFVPEAKKTDESVETTLLRKNIEWSEMFDSWAEGIDLFLVGKKVTKRENETSITLENSSFIKDRQGVHNTSNVNANVRLPNVEDYWQLKFTTYDEQDDQRGVKRGNYRQNPRARNVGATVGLAQSLGPVKTIFQPRIELRNPLRVSHSLIFQSVADMKVWQFHPKLEFFANPDKGTGIYGAMNFNFILDETYSVIWINDGEYQEAENKLSVNNGFSLVQGITEKSSFSYNLFFNSHNRPNYHIEGCSISVAWSQLLYKNILDYQIIPTLDFVAPEFIGATGLIFNINLNF